MERLKISRCKLNSRNESVFGDEKDKETYFLQGRAPLFSHTKKRSKIERKEK